MLLAKVQELLPLHEEFGDQNLLEHRGAILNLKSTDLVYEEEVIKLTRTISGLRVLFEHAGSIVARDDMMKSSGIATSLLLTNTLSVNVAHLRKLEEAGLSNFIETKKASVMVSPWINIEHLLAVCGIPAGVCSI